MLRNRVIPCLLVKDEGLVKTQRFAAPKYVGDPINAIRIFNDKEVDELIVLDIEASRQRREPNYALIEQMAAECFMPLCYGGGVRTVDQARRLFSLGVEKISVQTGALNDLALVSAIAERFGSQAIVASVDVKRNWLGRPKLYAASGVKLASDDWQAYLEKAIAAGAGEVLLNAVDRDGMMQGMDLELIRLASAKISVPLIATGGVGSLADIKSGIDAGASAIAAGAYFVFHGPHRAVLITYPAYGDVAKLLGQS